MWDMPLKQRSHSTVPNVGWRYLTLGGDRKDLPIWRLKILTLPGGCVSHSRISILTPWPWPDRVLCVVFLQIVLITLSWNCGKTHPRPPLFLSWEPSQTAVLAMNASSMLTTLLPFPVWLWNGGLQRSSFPGHQSAPPCSPHAAHSQCTQMTLGLLQQQ